MLAGSQQQKLPGPTPGIFTPAVSDLARYYSQRTKLNQNQNRLHCMHGSAHPWGSPRRVPCRRKHCLVMSRVNVALASKCNMPQKKNHLSFLPRKLDNIVMSENQFFFGLWSKSAANLRLVPQCAHENSLWSPGGPFSLARPWLVPLTICRSPSPSSTWAWQRSRPARYAVARYFSRRGWSLARRSCEEVAFQCKFELCGGEGVSPEFNHSAKKTKKTDGGS